MRSIRPLLLGSGVLVLPVALWWGFGLTLNHSPSVAPGIWYADEASPEAPTVGTVVRACLDAVHQAAYRARGYLRWGLACGGSEALLKPVGAVAGDRYAVTPEGVMVNGQLVPDTQPLAADDAGRPLAWADSGSVGLGEVFLISSWPSSLDSRYFGPVALANIQATMKPLWTWR